MQRVPQFLALGLLVLFLVCAGGAARRESVTVDETAHIGAGVSYLQRFDLRLNPEHPPLGKMIATAPLVARGVRADYSSTAWKESDSFFTAYLAQWIFGDWVIARWNNPERVLWWARVPMLLLAALLGGLVYVYASRLGGPWAGVLCVALYVSTPAFLAFGPLVVTDMPVTLFSVVTLWRLAETWRDPTRRNAVFLGGALAASLLSKFTAGIFFLAIPAFALQTRISPLPGEPTDKAERRSWRRLRWRMVLLGMLWAAVFVYVFYLVFSWNQPNDAAEKIPWGPVRRVVMPAWLYIRGLALMLLMSARPTFLLGHSYAHGVPFYFPVIVALKSPIGFLGLILVAIAASLLYRRRGGRPVIPDAYRVHWRVLWMGFVVFTAACLLSPLNISIRHFAIPLVLLILLMAPLPRMLRDLRGRVAWQVATAALAVSCVVTALLAYPYYIPYVNALGSGRAAYRLVNDSNVDWNQGLLEVRKFAGERGLRALNVDLLAMMDPALIVPGAEMWDCQAPAERDAGQWVVVSATMILENHNCAWLERYPREALAGGSVWAVRLPNPIPPAGSQGGPPPPSARKTLFGQPVDIRVMFLELDRNPEKLPAAMAKMMKEYEEQARKRK